MAPMRVSAVDVQPTTVYTFAGGGDAYDQAIKAVLESYGHSVQIGAGTRDLRDADLCETVDVVLHRVADSWRDLNAARDYVWQGGGLVVTGPIVWNFSLSDPYRNVLPAVRSGRYASSTRIAYRARQHHLVVHDGVAPSFEFEADAEPYTEYDLEAKPDNGALVLYESENFETAVVGGRYGQGRVVCIGAFVGLTALSDANFGRLVSNCLLWAAGPSDGDCLAEDHPEYAQWNNLGRPWCWCYPRQCHADADGLWGGNSKSGWYDVGPADLNVLISAWMVKEPPFGPGIASIPSGICADFNHDVGGSSKSGYFRVGPADLNVLMDYWLVKYDSDDRSGVPSDCGGRVEPAP
jgi:hypothetical protein